MSGGARENSRVRLARSAAVALTVLPGAALSRADTEILGPLGPVESGRSFVGLIFLGIACALVALAAAGLCYLAVRRRGARADGAESPDGAEPGEYAGDPFGEIDPGSDAAQFYAGLLCAVRSLLGRGAVPDAPSMTPRELRAWGLRNRGKGLERLSELCERAERAEYAGEDVPEDLREQDLAWARYVLSKGLARGTWGEDEGGD